MKTARTVLLDSNKLKATKLKKLRERNHVKVNKVKSKELQEKRLIIKQGERLGTTSHKSERETRERVNEEEKIIKRKKREIKTLSELELILMKNTNEILKLEQQEIDKLMTETKNPSDKYKKYKEQIKQLKEIIYNKKSN